MPQNTLNFTNVSDIKFQATSTQLKIYVNTTILGAINQNVPVTVFITESGSTKSITIKEISDATYTSGNTNNYLTDTVAFSFDGANAGFYVDVNSGSPNTYKTIGWEQDNVGQICIGISTSSTQLFDITSENNFKAKIETVNVGGVNQQRMVVRYSGIQLVKVQTIALALANAGLCCYVCD